MDTDGDTNGKTIVSVQFEVFGLVQGVYFTKYAKEMSDQRGIGGWVKNTKQGTIVGRMQGTRRCVDEMVQWLAKTGSPGCRIDKLELSNWEFLARQELRNFSIRF